MKSYHTCNFGCLNYNYGDGRYQNYNSGCLNVNPGNIIVSYMF